MAANILSQPPPVILRQAGAMKAIARVKEIVHAFLYDIYVRADRTAMRSLGSALTSQVSKALYKIACFKEAAHTLAYNIYTRATAISSQSLRSAIGHQIAKVCQAVYRIKDAIYDLPYQAFIFQIRASLGQVLVLAHRVHRLLLSTLPLVMDEYTARVVIYVTYGVMLLLSLHSLRILFTFGRNLVNTLLLLPLAVVRVLGGLFLRSLGL